ncbi:KAT8 regulatory NSL complex subunit 1-like isoform X2 [Watersipora subatra]
MTPRIVLQCISAASSKSASVSQNVEAHGGQLHKNSMSPLLASKLSGRPDLKSIAPSIEDVSKKQTQMEREICDVLKRITHLQGILATRHSKQQIKGFVESCMSVASQNSPGSTHSSIPLEVMNSPPDAPSIRNQLISHNMGVCENSSAYTCKVEKLFESTEDGLEHIRLRLPDRASSSSTNPNVKKKIETDIKMSSSSLRQLQMDIDSEVTDSSSGDDMDDEPSQGLSMAPSRADIKKTACWRWVRDRAMVISRWTWLQAQVADLEYKIRQHGELHKHLRSSKVSFQDELLDDQSSRDSAARCLPLYHSRVPRHQLVQASQAYTISRKARQYPIIKCQCVQTVRRCAICAGQHHYAKPADIETLHKHERVSRLDASYHPVLSFPQDVNPGIELEDIVNSNDKKLTATVPVDAKLLTESKKDLTRVIKKQKLALKLKKSKDNQLKAKGQKVKNGEITTKFLKQKKNKKKGKRFRSNSHAPKWSDDELNRDGTEFALSQSVPASLELNKNTFGTMNKRNTSAYDIDNIVIPYNLAAATRVERLQYKEIDTPRWREHLPNGTSVHEQQRYRTASISVPATPVTPAEIDIPSVPIEENLSVETGGNGAAESTSLTPVSSAHSLPASDHSSVSLAVSEIEEDISDSRYKARHRIMEAKEKSRYVNFVSSAPRRTRTHSATVGAGPNKSSSGSHMHSPGGQEVECVDVTTNSSEPSTLGQVTPAPLSASHDPGQLKEEMTAVARKRCSSFTGSRLKKEHSADIQEVVAVPPWPQRTFPLSEAELEQMKTGRKVSRRSSFHSSANRRWKVISTEEENSGEQKHPLVLKLSKN